MQAHPVLPKDEKFYPVKTESGKYVPNTACKPVEYIYEYCTKAPWRNIQYWERYTDKQLAALKELLQMLCTKHNIPKTYNADIWDVSRRALMGEAGIFCHVSYRNDKSDPHPQIELVNMLKSL